MLKVNRHRVSARAIDLVRTVTYDRDIAAVVPENRVGSSCFRNFLIDDVLFEYRISIF